jgi:hypothetical protein
MMDEQGLTQKASHMAQEASTTNSKLEAHKMTKTGIEAAQLDSCP